MNDPSAVRPNILLRVVRFYVDGFRAMTLGRYLWAIIIVKLAVLFLVFKLFFFPDRLARDYDSDEERARAVRRDLTDPRRQSDQVSAVEFVLTDFSTLFIHSVTYE